MSRFRHSTRAASKERNKFYMYAIGGLTVLAAIALLAVGYLAPRNIPGRSYYNIKAEFVDADNLTNSYQVRIGGRLVGQVLDPEVVDGKGVVRLQLITDVRPLKSDSTLRVRPRSAVGVRFVELVPGTKGEDLGEGDMLQSSQTSESVQLDEALNTFDADRRAKAATFFNQLGIGMLSRGQDINLSLRDAPKLLGDLDVILSEVNSRNDAPTRLVVQGSRAANAADPVRDTIAQGFRPQSEALDVFANHEDGLRQLLDTAPGALSGIRNDLPPVTPMLQQLRGMSAELTPALRAGTPALRNTRMLLTDARPGLRELPDTFDLVERAVPPTTKTLRTLLPVLPGTEKFLQAPLPIFDGLAPRGCDVGLFNHTWGSALGNQTANGGVFRLNLQFSQESAFGVTDAGAKGFSGPVRSNPYPAPCGAGNEGK